MYYEDHCSRILVNRIRKENPRVRNVAILSIKRSKKICLKSPRHHFIAQRLFKGDSCYRSSSSNDEEERRPITPSKNYESSMNTQELLREHVFNSEPEFYESDPFDKVECDPLTSTQIESKELALEESSDVHRTYRIIPRRVLLKSYYNGAIQVFSHIWKRIFNEAPIISQRKESLIVLSKPFKRGGLHQINVVNISDESSDKIYDINRTPNFPYKSIHNALKMFYGEEIKVCFVSAVYLASVLEYFSFEVLSKAKEFLEKDKSSRNEIEDKHIYLALRGSEVTNVLTKDVLYPFPQDLSS